MNEKNTIKNAVKTIELEESGLKALKNELNGKLEKPFNKTIKILKNIKGRVIISGMGKSGHVGAKIAATLASTGTPAHFVHPAEAKHGDLGMIADEDAVIALSWSGETVELNAVIEYTKRFSIPLIAITAGESSVLAEHADVVLALPNEREACPHNLAPTTSSIMSMAMGDAIAIALLEEQEFSATDFGNLHPGGKLGAQLMKVKDIMHKDKTVPLVKVNMKMTEAIMQISEKGFGCVGVVNEKGMMCGIITDGDLRRNLTTNLLGENVEDVMTKNPMTINEDILVAEALELLNKKSITALMVTEESKPVGIVHLHDLLRVGVA